MKTAISVPDALHKDIETFLKATGVSRSEFFQRAARAYLDKVSAKAITANLDKVYGKEAPSANAAFRQAALAHLRDLIGQEDW